MTDWVAARTWLRGNEFRLVGVDKIVPLRLNPQPDPRSSLGHVVHQCHRPAAQPDLHAQLSVGDTPEQLHRLDEVALARAVGADQHGDRAEGQLDLP